MKNQYKIEEDVRKTMASLDRLDRVDGNPFLFTRIKAKLEDSSKPKSFQFAGVLQIGMVAVLLLVNLISLNKKVEASFGEEVILENIAIDYGLQSSQSTLNYYNQN